MSAYKPKVYRSQDGCCICKAKSSSSRFTDSGKYESDCTACFKLADQRTGEICNACVLIVKRWKKLPRNTAKNWAHVVDARTGPGTKNIFKQKKKPEPTSPFEKFKYKHVYKRKPLKTKRRTLDYDVGVMSDSSVARSVSPLGGRSSPPLPSFLDSGYWRSQQVCCGLVYIGRLGEVMLDQRHYRPCSTSAHNMRVRPDPAPLLPSETSSPTPSAFPETATSLAFPETNSPTSLAFPSTISPTSSGAFSSTSTSSAFSVMDPSSIESLVEAELQAFQNLEADTEMEEEFYPGEGKMLGRAALNSSTDCEGDEGFCDRLDRKSEQFRSSLSLIATH